MARVMLLLFALLAAGCASGAGPAPESLALAEPQEVNVMRFNIDGESFELQAGICNTYDDGTFRFSLAEGTVEETGRVTATIERFDSGSSFDVLLALEGVREDGSPVTWYAKDPLEIHQIAETVSGGYIRGTAVFDSVGGDNPTGMRANGDFSIRCSG